MAKGRKEILVPSPGGIGLLKLTNNPGPAYTFQPLMMSPNSIRFGGWLLNTGDNQFRSFQDMTGVGRAEIIVESPWCIKILTLQGASFQVPMMVPNGTRLGV